MEKSNDLYLLSRMNKLEERVERLEALIDANRVTVQNRSEFFSINEFAAALSVSRQTIYRKVERGEIKSLKIGKTYRIPRSELEKHIKLEIM